MEAKPRSDNERPTLIDLDVMKEMIDNCGVEKIFQSKIQLTCRMTIIMCRKFHTVKRKGVLGLSDHCPS